MSKDSFFTFDSYHLLLAVIGLAIIAARWLPRWFSTREPVAAPLMVIFGMAVFWLVPGIPAIPDPRESPRVWELVSELTVIVALFAAGIRIDNLHDLKRWTPTLRMLGIAMPITIAAVALLGYGLVGMTVAGAILLGAVLAPTDPVLAGDVQVGPPLEGGEHPVRFTLTTEAALNDGLAFPFVYLGLIVAAQGLFVSDWIVEWLLRDVFYRIAVGAVFGWAGGWLLGNILFRIPRHSVLADTSSGVVALAGVILCYGSTELVEGYGFISVAVMGLSLRRIEARHAFHSRLHDFAESIEHALTAMLLIALGGALPVLFASLTWQAVVVAIALIVVIRPAAGIISLAGTEMGRTDRRIVAFFGVRGIGSIYYLGYAGAHMEFINEPQLWALVGFIILLSTLIHGFSASWVMESVKD